MQSNLAPFICLSVFQQSSFFGFKLYIYVQAEIEDGNKHIKVLCVLRVRERRYTLTRDPLHVRIMAEKSEKLSLKGYIQ